MSDPAPLFTQPVRENRTREISHRHLDSSFRGLKGRPASVYSRRVSRGPQTQAMNTQDLFSKLEQLGIATRTVEHEAVFTVEQAQAIRGELSDGAHIKNLFLRNKKGRMWLVVLAEDTPLDLKALGATLGSGRLSFASPERLDKHLGVSPGAVNPFAICNDEEGLVILVLDRSLQDEQALWCHPLRNDMTTRIATADLLRFASAMDHPVEFVSLPRRN